MLLQQLQPRFRSGIPAASPVCFSCFFGKSGAFIDDADVVIGLVTVHTFYGKLFHSSSFLELGDGLIEEPVIHIDQSHQENKIGPPGEFFVNAEQIQCILISFQVKQRIAVGLHHGLYIIQSRVYVHGKT